MAMSYFAKIENNLVVKVIVADQEFVSTLEGLWVETFGTELGGPDRNLEDESRNPPVQRGYYAAIGFLYNEQEDKFSPPIPQEPILETDPEILGVINQTKIVSLP